MVTNEALTFSLNELFRNHGPWYILLFNSNSYPCRDCTYADPDFTEFVGYDNLTRPEFVEGAPSGYVISNSANKASFTINTETNIYGAALVGKGSSPNVKGDTSGGGIIFSSARLVSSVRVIPDQVIAVQYSIGANAPIKIYPGCV